MSNYNWCHNPDCHTYHTQDRIRGVKGSKVLRTRKIRVLDPLPRWYQGWENHFCRVNCFFNYVKKHITNIVAISPVLEPSETPIDVQVINHPEHTTEYGWTRKAWTEKRITPIENN
jgi:hypothetical protein|tara:strand:+ start:185 stop:532 length:348 start_codon:yes stop_codon:yes gene_type:complete